MFANMQISAWGPISILIQKLSGPALGYATRNSHSTACHDAQQLLFTWCWSTCCATWTGFITAICFPAKSPERDRCQKTDLCLRHGLQLKLFNSCFSLCTSLPSLLSVFFSTFPLTPLTRSSVDSLLSFSPVFLFSALFISPPCDSLLG